MGAGLQLTFKQMLRAGYYEECLAESATAKIADTPLPEIESREDLLAFIGYMMKASQAEREGHRIAFVERQFQEEGDSGRLAWLGEDQRRLLSAFRFCRSNDVSVAQAVDWMMNHHEDEELPPEFLKAFKDATDGMDAPPAPVKLYIWEPPSHGPLTFSVVETSEEEAKRKVVEIILASRLSESEFEGWPNDYTLRVLDTGEAITFRND